VIRLHWTPQASDDLAAIFAYIAKSSAHYAQLTVRELIAAVGPLRDFPEVGRIVPELNRPDVAGAHLAQLSDCLQTTPLNDAVRLTIFRGERLFQLPDDLR
jgi:plasmid stabilization system protein ParE